MNTNEKNTKLNLDAIIYPEAPESFSETESGKLILNATELQLPGDIIFKLAKLKNASYEKIEAKHVIKLTTTSENDLYISIPGENKLKIISYVEIISYSIRSFASTAVKNNASDAERKAKEEAERKAKEEAERKAKEEAGRKAKEEAERKAKEEAERKAKEEAERKAKEEADRKAKEEAERKATSKRVPLVIGLLILIIAVTACIFLLTKITTRSAPIPTADNSPAPTPFHNTQEAPIPDPIPVPSENNAPTDIHTNHFISNSNPDPYILSGPHFSLDEPWTIKQFNEALVGKTCGFEKVTNASQLETTQGKTIKTEVGKIYYLEVEFSYNYCAFIGLRRSVNDKQIVTFYTVKSKDDMDITLNSGGSVEATYSAHSLNDIYNATSGDTNFRIIEFNQNDWSERLCRDEEFTDEVTGEIDTEAQKKCEKSSISMTQRKLAFAIDENGEIIASEVVSDLKAKCNDIKKCRNELSQKVKSIKEVEEFTLGDMVCVPNETASPNEAPHVTCRSNTSTPDQPTTNHRKHAPKTNHRHHKPKTNRQQKQSNSNGWNVNDLYK